MFALLLVLALPVRVYARETTVGLDPGWMVDRWTRADGLPLDHLNDVAMDLQGYLWIASFEGLSRFDGDTVRTWRREDLPGLRTNRLVSVVAAPDGHMLIDDEAGTVYRYDPARRPLVAEVVRTPSAERPSPDEERARAAAEEAAFAARATEVTPRPGADIEGRKDGARTRLDAWRYADGILRRGETRVAGIEGLARRLLDDGAGGLWLATHAGLLHVRPAIARTLDPLPDEAVATVLVRSAGDTLWAVIERVGGWRIARIIADQLTAVDLGHGDAIGETLRPAGDGTMRVLGEGARYLLAGDGTLTRVGDSPAPFEGPRAWIQTRDGAEWILDVVGGVFRAPPGGGPWVSLSGPNGRIVRPRDLLMLDDGRVLLLEAGSGMLVGPPHDLRARAPGNAVPSLEIRGARIDGDTLWLGTEDAGLCRIRPVSAVLDAPVRCVSAADGLGDHNIHATLDDGLGRLWMGTNRGVIVVARDALDRALDGAGTLGGTIRIDERDGLVNSETNNGQWAVERTADGRLWFPTMGGPVVIDPTRLPAPTPLHVQLDDVRVNGEERANTGALALAEDEREVQLRWSVPEYTRPEQVRFRYRLEGLDADWRGLDDGRGATWSRLPAGALTVVVQASLGGDWGPELRVDVSRTPAFTESNAFPLALMVGTAASSAAVAGLWGVQRRRRVRALEAEVARRTVELSERNGELHERNLDVLRQAEQLRDRARALAEVEAAKSRFVANLSHELRTPLMLVMGSLEDLSTGPVTGERLQLATRNAERLRELVDQLFDVVRLEAGRLPMRARRLDAAAFLRDLTARLAPIAAARGIRLAFDPETPPAWVWADPDLLEKIVGNLLGNALKFTPRGGTVQVRLVTGADSVRIRVVDDGPGVSPRDAERIFERFYQVESGDDRHAEGAGIGLSLARELAELHGGTLRLVAPDGDAGATFEFTLPTGTAHLALGDIALDERSGERPGERTAMAAPPAGPGRGRVLLVEDHPELRAYLADRLAEQYTVEAVADGRAALARLQEGGIGLLLSDIMLPGMDGIALCRAARGDPGLVGLPIVLLSAKGRAAEPEALAAGADIFLPKPILGSALMAALRTLLPHAAESTDEAPAPAPSAGTRADADTRLLARIEGLARSELKSPTFSVEVLAGRLGMSPRTLQRTLNRLVGKAPVGWLQELRLEVARDRLRDGASVSEAADAVGLSTGYFSKLYIAWFGYPPSREGERAEA